MMVLRLAVIYLVAAVLISAVLAVADELPVKYAINKRFVTTDGVVLSTNCSQHMIFSYMYRVSGIAYTGKSRGENCTDLRPGDLVTIYYQMDEPAVSSGLNPRSSFTNDIAAIAFAAFGGAGLFVLLFLKRARNRC